MRFVFASTRENAGKTSVILGLMKNLDKKVAYLKPFGDRLLYKKKRLWDHDCALINRVFSRDFDSDDTTIGFEHSKLLYMYDKESLKKKLVELVQKAESFDDVVYIESSKTIAHGSSVGLGALDIVHALDASLILLTSGTSDEVMDDLNFLSRSLDPRKVKGVIVNRQNDVEEFMRDYAPRIKALGYPLLGVLPFDEKLSRLTVHQISDGLLAKILTCEDFLGNPVDHIDVAAMSVTEATRQDVFRKENNLVITSGDRVDIMLAALECDPSAIILTNNILPPHNIISLAEQKRVPVLSVNLDTFAVAKKVDDMQSVIFSENADKISQVTNLVGKNVNIKQLME